jgi:LPXTG-site transpeptidase (sortase) family protein
MVRAIVWRILISLLMVIGIFLLVVPHGARFQLAVQQLLSANQVLAQVVPEAFQPSEVRPKAKLGDEWLVIPAIHLAVPLVRGNSLEVLDREWGVWLQSEADARNIIVAGHRFRYARRNAATLANAGRLKVGDSILLRKDGTTQEYRITLAKEVTTEETSYLAPQARDILTLYTCTLTNEGTRLVIQADLLPAAP